MSGEGEVDDATIDRLLIAFHCGRGNFHNVLWTADQRRSMRDALAELAALSTPQARPTIRVQKLGMYGAAYDGPEDKRAYTYTHQPANGPAYSLGHALSCAAIRQGGDFIDGGLSLLKELEAKGFGVFEIADLPAPSVQARPDGGAVVAWTWEERSDTDVDANPELTEEDCWSGRCGFRVVEYVVPGKVRNRRPLIYGDTHPAPAPDVAALVERIQRIADDLTGWGYEADTAAVELREALTPFTAQPDGGEACRYCDGTGYFYSDPDLGPCNCTAPAPDVARLVEAAKEIAGWDDMVLRDQFCAPLANEVQALREALAPFTAAQQKEATNGQE